MERKLQLQLFFFAISISICSAQTDSNDFSKNFCLIETSCSTFKEANETAKFINKNGGQVAVISSPTLFVGWVSKDNRNKLIGTHKITSITHKQVNQKNNKFPNSIELPIIQYFNSVVSGEIFKKEVKDNLNVSKFQKTNISELLKVKKNIQNSSKSNTTDYTYESNKYNSEYMVGSVVIALFFVESDGSIDENKYSWSQADINETYQEIIDACVIWTWTAHNQYNVDTYFSWKVFGYNNQIVLQPYEPVLHKSIDDGLWINSIMSNLGYNEDYFLKLGRVAAYNTSLREEYNSDHSFSAFIANNAPYNGGQPDSFTNGQFSYAHRGGPYAQFLRNSNIGFFRVFGHEMGHIFHAFDEYYEASNQCYNSFNGISNTNHECRGNNQTCLMDDNSFTGVNNREWVLCNYTPSHIGWENLTTKANLTSPANNSTVDANSITFKWNRNTLLSDPIYSYLKIKNKNTNEVIFFEKLDFGSETKVLNDLPIGSYEWQIFNGNDDDSDGYALVESETRTFTISSPTFPILAFNDYIVYDGTNEGGEGDGDGKAESGEQIELNIRIFNSGTTNAQSVRAILSTNDPDITITDDNNSFGRIDPNTGEWSAGLEFDISFSCPSKNVTFTLDITSNEGQWSDTFTIPVYYNPTVSIPDANFERALIDEEIDSDGIINQKILISDALAVTDDLRLDNRNITDLTGIGAFKNMRRLYCADNQLTNLDISQNTALTKLGCVGNLLQSLDISNNNNLLELYCGANKIEYLDFSKNIGLTKLSCGGNLLQSLDISKLTSITYLSCSGNQLSSLYLDNNTELTNLRCKNNKLENLDVTNNTKLLNLECELNQLTSLDVSQNNALIELWCRSNQLTEIIFSQNNTLSRLECRYNKLTSLDISKNTALLELDCRFNDLISLDASKNSPLLEIDCSYNQLVFLDMRNGIDPVQIDLRADNNVNLACINIDNESINYEGYWHVDEGVTFSNDCKYLSISPDNRDVEFNQGLTNFNVFSNMSWTVNEDLDWLTISDITNDNFIANFSENNVTNIRVGNITISATGITKNVTVTQSAMPCFTPTDLILINNTTQVSAELDWGTVTGAISYDFDYRVQGDSAWISISLTTSDNILEGLSCETTYDYRIRTVCGNNDYSSWSDTQTFSTSICDSDNDGVGNIDDLCHDTPTGEVVNTDGCSQSQLDDDGDGIMNDIDNCPNTSLGATVDVFGCEVFNMPANNYEVKVVSASCIGSTNGIISTKVIDQNYKYTVNVTGQDSYNLDPNVSDTKIFENLSKGTYEVCFTIEGKDNYEQCFEVAITEPAPITSAASFNDNILTLNLSGSEIYNITINGQVQTHTGNTFTSALKAGLNHIEVSTNLDCQGIYTEDVFISDSVLYYPNPTSGIVNVYINGSDNNVSIQIINMAGVLVQQQNYEVSSNRRILLDLGNNKSGTYLIKIKGKTINYVFKILKK